MTQPLIHITYKKAILFACFLVFYEFLTYIANDMIMPGMIHVVHEFHAPATAMASSLTAYILGGGSLQLLLGPVSDRYGRRPVMLWGASLFFVFTVLLACVDSMSWFLVARFFEGMGLCFISVVGYAVLQEIFEERDAIRLISIMASVAILAPLLGPLLGALLLHLLDWRLIFIMIGGLALFALWGLWRYMPESVGALLRDGRQIQPKRLSLRHVAFNYRSLWFNRPFLLGAMAYGLLAIPCVAWIGLSPEMLVNEAHLSLIAYGFWQLPVFGAFIAGNMTLSRLSRYWSLKAMINGGAVIVMLGLLLMLVLPLLYKNSVLWLIPGLMLYSFGYSLVATPMNRWMLFASDVGKGTVSAGISMLSMSFQFVGVEVINHYYIPGQWWLFGAYCAVLGGLYVLLLLLARFFEKKRLSENTA